VQNESKRLPSYDAEYLLYFVTHHVYNLEFMVRNSEIKFYSLRTVNVHTYATLILLKAVKLSNPCSHDGVTSSEEGLVGQIVCRIQDNCEVSSSFQRTDGRSKENL